jgi:hypothetical protein
MCCGFLSLLKIHRLVRVLNLQPLGPVASTVTTIPPRRQVSVLRRWKPALHLTLICCTTHCALPLDHHEEVESLGLLAQPAGWIHRKNNMHFHLYPKFFVNFQHYYTLYFRACASWSNKTVGFDLLAVLLHLSSTRVGEICARTSLIYLHSSCFIARSFSLNVNDRKRIPFLFTSCYNGHTYQTPRLLPAYCS